MPQTKQAKKELRKGQKRAELNLAIKEDLKTLIKKTKQAITKNESKDKVGKMIKDVQKSIDKAVQKRTIKKNTGSRKLSRLIKYSRTDKSKDSKEVQPKPAVEEKIDIKTEEK